MLNWLRNKILATKQTTELAVDARTDGESSSQTTLPEYEILKNRGNAYLENDQWEEAATCYRRAIKLKPDYAEAYTNLGFVSQAQGNFDEAITLYQKAVTIKPDLLPAHQNLGFILMKLGQVDDAEASLRRVIELSPNDFDALQNLGVITAQRGNFTDAEIFLRRATKLHPESFSVHANLGNLFKQNNRMSEAETSYRHALALKPDFADAYSNLGIVLMDTGRMTEAKAACRRAIELKPDFAEAHNNFGLVLKDSGQPELAAAHYRQALKIKPDYAEALNNLGIELQVMGQVDNALASFQRALELKADSVVTHSNLIFTRDLMVDADQKTLLGERKRWNAMHAAHLYQQQKFQNIPYPERRLRVGYVSADFRNHSAATAFGSMLINFDSTNFEVIAYSNTIKEDILTREFQQCVTSWRSIVGLSDNAASDLIRQDKIDILVDLSGHTAGNRLLVFARKPAPIQITAWGYASGTGMSAMDVFFTDPVMVPPEEKHLHVEKIRYLPSAIGYYHYGSAPPVNPLPALSGKNITFGSFNRLLKNSKEAYHTWAQVLHRLPDSRMILKTQALDDPDTRARVTGYFTQAGIAPERIILMGGTSRDAHMSAFNHVDISLDPFPHGGGVSALEGLIMGVPLVTLRWPTLVGRVSASIMTSIGLDDWVAETQEQYIELAVQKAENLQSLAELRQNLRDLFTSSILGDKVAYTRIAEHEYRKLWKEWCLLAEK